MRMTLLSQRLCTFPPRRISMSTFAPKIDGNLAKGGIGLQVGQYATVKRIFTAQEVESFGQLIGDQNPLHQSWSKATIPAEIADHNLVKWQDDGNSMILVHGMLGASLFSCLFASRIPGSVYLSQSLDFVKPIYVEEEVTAKITVEDLRNRKGIILSCSTTVTSGQGECIRGQAKVWISNSTTET